ncbi:hypothetical protein TSA6c_32690 [Azospirillum sp. TSA6c]|uniref:hypothetical protein n=1 Tax=Azospirillum sp. TSA6c TaxID=709813 RepID=UPI000D618927|nr:hypothetical protein [Azospirillum sp. TSA6c]PWC50633.1 hypothetical protein TSA6c_32690 [Azospirillum sp. TSA6c]
MDEARSTLRSAISDMDSPLTSAEAATTTLNMIASELEDDDRSVAIVYLADMIRIHLNDLRERFGRASRLKADQPAA